MLKPGACKWMLSHGAPADPSDPWNSHAAPVSPRQTSVTCNATGLPPLARCHEGADGEPQPEQHAVTGQMSANTWALTLILHRTQRVADEAINRALDCSLTSHRGAPWSTQHVTCVTRHAQNAKPTSRCRTVAPWSPTMASSAARWVRWRIKVKAHVLAP